MLQSEFFFDFSGNKNLEIKKCGSKKKKFESFKTKEEQIRESMEKTQV
jgi:hypothetical protein